MNIFVKVRSHLQQCNIYTPKYILKANLKNDPKGSKHVPVKTLCIKEVVFNGYFLFLSLYKNFIIYVCAFLKHVLILALIVIQLNINFIIHPCAFVIYIFIQVHIYFVYYQNFLIFYFILLSNLLLSVTHIIQLIF